MKLLITLLSLFVGFQSIQAQIYAVELCSHELKEKIQALEIEGELKVRAHLEYENYLIIECANASILNELCYVGKVKQWRNQFCFNTSKILIKLKREDADFIAENALVKHKFIPNLFYINTQLKSELELSTLAETLSLSDLVLDVNVNQIFSINTCTNDPLFNRQWSIDNVGSNLQSSGTAGADMKVDSAWQISTGSSSLKIAILDSGVDTLHEDLVDNLLSGFDAFANDTADTKGYPTPNFSSDGHGTACAGIVAAVSENNIGIAGIAPDCKIIPIRIFYYKDYGTGIGVQATTSTDVLLSGSAYAWRMADADIMSTSAGLSPLFIAALSVNTSIINAEILSAFNEARNNHGIAMFFSAGNDDTNDVLWPADLEETIAVGASSMCDERKNPNDCSPENWGSSYGLSLDVVAPGVRICTTDMRGSNGFSGNDYTFTFNGTSAACPNAAGVGALILSMNPNYHARDIKGILNLSADRVGDYSYDSMGVYGGWNEEMGNGRVNAYEALKLTESYLSTEVKEHIALMSDLNIYPNPSADQVFFSNKSKAEMYLEVFNFLGESILEFQLEAQQEMKLDLPAGAYIVKEKLSNKQYKFLKK